MVQIIDLKCEVINESPICHIFPCRHVKKKTELTIIHQYMEWTILCSKLLHKLPYRLHGSQITVEKLHWERRKMNKNRVKSVTVIYKYTYRH